MYVLHDVTASTDGNNGLCLNNMYHTHAFVDYITCFGAVLAHSLRLSLITNQYVFRLSIADKL